MPHVYLWLNQLSMALLPFHTHRDHRIKENDFHKPRDGINIQYNGALDLPSRTPQIECNSRGTLLSLCSFLHRPPSTWTLPFPLGFTSDSFSGLSIYIHISALFRCQGFSQVRNSMQISCLFHCFDLAFMIWFWNMWTTLRYRWKYEVFKFFSLMFYKMIFASWFIFSAYQLTL